MQTGALNPLETRKRPSQWPQLGLAVLMLVVLGAAGWYILVRVPVEIPADEWVTHTGDGYTVRLPKAADTASRANEHGDSVHLATVELTARVYAVAWSEYDVEQLDLHGPDELLDFAMREGMAAIDGTITDAVELIWKGNPGREFHADVPGGKAHYRLFLVGTRMYRLAIIHAPGFKPDPEAFFESFALT